MELYGLHYEHQIPKNPIAAMPQKRKKFRPFGLHVVSLHCLVEIFILNYVNHHFWPRLIDMNMNCGDVTMPFICDSYSLIGFCATTHY
jgi:hypothetical protein